MKFEIEDRGSDSSNGLTEKAQQAFNYKHEYRNEWEDQVKRFSILTLGLAAVWIVVDISYLQSNHPFPIGVWHGITSSLCLAATAVWALAEIHLLNLKEMLN